MSNAPQAVPAANGAEPKFSTPIAERFRAGADPNNERGRKFPQTEPVKQQTQENNSETHQQETTTQPTQTQQSVSESTQNQQQRTESHQETKPNPLAEALSKPKGKEESLAELRKSLETERALRLQREKDLESVKSQVPSDYEQIKKDRETLVEEIERVKIEASPRFKEKYDKPLNELAESIRRDVQSAEVKSDDIIDLINKPSSKERNTELSKLIDGMDRITAGKVTNTIARIEELRDARNQELLKPSQTFAQMQQEAKAQQEAQRQNYISALDSVLEKAKKDFLAEKEGNTEWNNRVSAISDTAKKFWLGTDNKLEDLAQLTLDGASLPVYKEALEISRAQIEELSAQLAELRGATPSNGAASSSSSAGGSEKPMGALAAFRQAVPRR